MYFILNKGHNIDYKLKYFEDKFNFFCLIYLVFEFIYNNIIMIYFYTDFI